jgi:hypothetical protein
MLHQFPALDSCRNLCFYKNNSVQRKIMNSNWDNFLKNLGEWQGSFTTINPHGQIVDSTPSILNLIGHEDNKMVKFRVRRYAEGYENAPISDFENEYRSIGRQNTFFDTGAFVKGTIQISPVSEFGAEFGFVNADRRLRFVQLFDQDRKFDKVVLIREFRTGTPEIEQPPLTVDRLLGRWQGQATTAFADLASPDVFATTLEITRPQIDQLTQKLQFAGQEITSHAQIIQNKLIFSEGSSPREVLLLPDGGSSNVPLQIPLRTPTFVEVGWLVSDRERQRLMRTYNDKGEWISSTHIIEHKVD